ncbi:MAG: hypothetical protein GOVbin1807_171 [Prokaryotic dsDNA virus sp.]|nr:MAG: hypothetical protein GOVbin1807_171 [Prokaryotic dsDNA virus sp.]|tara:strand:+ start:3536 stop:4465 length:930 start_codon:yes stop_codon:yes gene_type:complete
MKIKINKKEEIEEVSAVGVGAIQGSAVSNMASHPPRQGTDKRMKQDEQTEQMLREYIRNKIRQTLDEEKKQEQQLREVIRSIIKEAKDQANPHPSTGINKLRDAFRKAKPSIKSKFQQLTTSEEQRTSFTAHLLNAFISLFQQMDALNAQGGDPEPVPDAEIAGPSLAAPPEGEDVQADIKDDISNLLQEISVDIEDDENIDVVTDEEEPAPQSQVEKDVEKKKNLNAEREEFGSGLSDMDKTGRNQSFDAFRLVQSYFSDAYLDLDNETDRQMFKDWCLYNLELLLKSYESELNPALEKPEIENPEGA